MFTTLVKLALVAAAAQAINIEALSQTQDIANLGGASDLPTFEECMT